MYQEANAKKTALKDYYDLIYSINTRTRIDNFDQRASMAYIKASPFLNGNSERYSNAIKAAGILNEVKIKQGILVALPQITSQSLALKEVEDADKLVNIVLRELEEQLFETSTRR